MMIRESRVLVLLVLALAAAACADSKVASNTGSSAAATSASTRAPSAESSAASMTGDVADTVASQPAVTSIVPPKAGTSRRARADSTPAPDRKPERSTRHVVVNGLDLTGIGYDRGSDSAPVVLVDFSDFACPYCRSFARETEPSIEREYVQTGQVFFKYVPFVVGTFPNGQQAARAAECAADQGRFWPMYQQLYARQSQWKETIYALPVFERFAASLGMDSTQFEKCYSTNHLHPRSKQANDAADALGVRVTPSFVVNGRAVEGALPLKQFREVLDAALREAKANARGPGSR
jgi:protein-disulfide isomerase